MLRFLVNPAAGGGRARRFLTQMRRRAERDGATLEVSTSGSDLAARASRAVAEGVRRLAVAGGDGTVHLACQALAGTECSLAVLPIGRGNDFAATVGVPKRFEAALDLAVDGPARSIDLGRVAGEWFAFYAGVGFDSATSKTADGHPRWWPDSITYVIAVFRTLVGFRAPSARIRYDGGTFEGEVMFATVCNGERFGGGMRIAPPARLDDGWLDLVIVRRINRLELLRIFPSVYRGRHVDHPAVSIHRTRSVHLAFEPEAMLGSDGELIGSVGADGVEVDIVPNALSVVAAT